MTALSIRYWGVRGSIPVPGPTTVAFGGNTSCLEVRTGQQRIILDAGTGIARLGATLHQPETLKLFLSHLHWDHIQGFPFFAPIYRKGFAIDIYSGHKADVSLESVLQGQMQEPNFPMNMNGLPAKLSFNEIQPDDGFTLGDIEISSVPLNHPQGATGFGFKVGNQRFVHLTDHEHTPEFDESVVRFCQDADILSMDTMYAPEEYPNHVGWGHSSWLHACEIARRAGIGQLVLFHHNPIYDDARLEEILERARVEFPNTILAREGLELSLGA